MITPKVYFQANLAVQAGLRQMLKLFWFELKVSEKHWNTSSELHYKLCLVQLDSIKMR